MPAVITKATGSADETARLGESYGKKIKGPAVLALVGQLGSGKTTFIKGLARGLGVKNVVTSPTFVVYKQYPASKARTFYHFDLYRIKRSAEFLELGFREIIDSQSAVTAIEWPEKAEGLLPPGTVRVHFQRGKSEEQRIISIK